MATSKRISAVDFTLIQWFWSPCTMDLIPSWVGALIIYLVLSFFVITFVCMSVDSTKTTTLRSVAQLLSILWFFVDVDNMRFRVQYPISLSLFLCTCNRNKNVLFNSQTNRRCRHFYRISTTRNKYPFNCLSLQYS